MKSDSASLRQALAERMTLSEAVEAVGRMLAARASGRPANPRAYIGAIAGVVLEYPRAVSERCLDPVHGVLRVSHFMPEVADVAAWCDRAMVEMRRPVDVEDYEMRARRRIESIPARHDGPRLAREEIEAKLGRPIGTAADVWRPSRPLGDGRHVRRVMADLARRRGTNQSGA